jgi:transcriptional regulator with XRE-family HTH domain
MSLKPFSKLLDEAQKRDAYWVADAIYTFTEELHKLTESKNISRAELARRLGVSPAYVTKIFRGNVNFTIDSMVRLARAVGARLHLHLAPEGQEVGRPCAHSRTRQKASGLKADQYESIPPEKVMEGKPELIAFTASKPKKREKGSKAKKVSTQGEREEPKV